MKSFALLCFLLLASVCVFVARAEEETPAVDDAPKMEDQPETADVEADEEQDDEEQDDEEETEADEENEDEETEEDEEETTDVADDEPEKRGWACKRYRRGRLWCKACGCRRVCKAKWCNRRVCKRVRCGSRKVCRWVTRYRIVKYKYKIPYYRGYGPRFVWKTKRVPYRVRVCVNVPNFCTRCSNLRYRCGNTCSNVCRYRRCFPYYG